MPNDLALDGFARGDRVVVPSGEIARVLGADPLERRLELQYVGALRADHGIFTLPAKLVRRCDNVPILPKPVRIC